MTLTPEQLLYRPKPPPGNTPALRLYKRWRADLIAAGYRPCAHCRQVLEARFFREISPKRGPSSYCMSCENQRQRDWQAEKRKAREAVVETEMAAMVPALPDMTETGIIAGDQAQGLHRVTVKALLKLEQIIDMGLPNPKDASMFIKLLSEQRQAAQAVIATQVRVDENVLRARTDDAVGRILAAIERNRKKLKLVAQDLSAGPMLEG